MSAKEINRMECQNYTLYKNKKKYKMSVKVLPSIVSIKSLWHLALYLKLCDYPYYRLCIIWCFCQEEWLGPVWNIIYSMRIISSVCNVIM